MITVQVSQLARPFASHQLLSSVQRDCLQGLGCNLRHPVVRKCPAAAAPRSKQASTAKPAPSDAEAEAAARAAAALLAEEEQDAAAARQAKQQQASKKARQKQRKQVCIANTSASCICDASRAQSLSAMLESCFRNLHGMATQAGRAVRTTVTALCYHCASGSLQTLVHAMTAFHRPHATHTSRTTIALM